MRVPIFPSLTVKQTTTINMLNDNAKELFGDHYIPDISADHIHLQGVSYSGIHYSKTTAQKVLQHFIDYMSK